MGTVSRTAYVSGASVAAAGQNTNEKTHLDEFNGSIDDINVRATAAIKGSKLADAPNGIPTTKLNDNVVTSTKLSSDAALDANRAVGKDHIKAAVVTFDKVKSTEYTNPGVITTVLTMGNNARRWTHDTGIPTLTKQALVAW